MPWLDLESTYLRRMIPAVIVCVFLYTPEGVLFPKLKVLFLLLLKTTHNLAPTIQTCLPSEYIYILNMVAFFVQGLPGHLGRHYLTVRDFI